MSMPCDSIAGIEVVPDAPELPGITVVAGVAPFGRTVIMPCFNFLDTSQ
jgi:hypothetical protein